MSSKSIASLISHLAISLLYFATLFLIITSVEIELFAIWPWLIAIPLSGLMCLICSLLPKYAAKKNALLAMTTAASFALFLVLVLGKPFLAHYFYNNRDYKGVFIQNHHSDRP